MEPAVARIYRPEQLARATEAWGIEAQSARSLGDFENYVYEVAYRGRPAILRLTHSSHRTPELVRAELGWIGHLGGCGVGVCRAIASERGDLLEVVPAEEGAFTAVLFERAAGQRARRTDPA
jgi:Ser/Thr protein kinase RdoA (MazF antagonist)